MSLCTRLRLRLLIALVGLLFASIGIMPTPAHAGEHCHLVEPELRQITEITYYSDAQRTTIVGFEIWLCNGNMYLSGEQTRYFDIFHTDYCPIDGGGGGGGSGGGGGGGVPPQPL